jgi:hypothetical protein
VVTVPGDEDSNRSIVLAVTATMGTAPDVPAQARPSNATTVRSASGFICFSWSMDIPASGFWQAFRKRLPVPPLHCACPGEAAFRPGPTSRSSS